MTIHSTLYSCDICGQPYQGLGTGGVTTWSWAGVTETMDLCPDCVATVRARLLELRGENACPSPGPAAGATELQWI